jgi:RecA-family ATPase
LLTIAVAYLLGLKDFDDEECEIGEWQVKKRVGTLYIDGELGEQEMEDRIKKFEWLGVQRNPIRVLSIPEYQLATEDSFYLSDRGNQLKIIQWLKNNPRYKLVVLDSASTLFGLVEENDNSEWNNKINPFLRDLRALGVACILLHHSGKDNKRGLRGASSMGAMAHNIFKLSNHTDKNIDDGEAWFILTKDKQRAGGYSFKTFALHFTQENDETETHWEITHRSIKG